uniref:Uncharacterized protein n=1 Tax=Pipistrellus kuhlii TaxID=59472 RepID=A0A7J7X0R4_PIPKU|nr:hypothetical protein mPipKuh1_010775 [Pipistrellus kuhlii]
MDRKGVFLVPEACVRSGGQGPGGQGGHVDSGRVMCSGPPLLRAQGFPGRRGSGALASELGRRGKPSTRPEAVAPQMQPGEATALFLLPRPKRSFQSSTFYILSVFTRGFERKTESRWTPFLLLNSSSCGPLVLFLCFC